MSNTQCRLLLLVKIIWITRIIQTTIKSYLNQCAWARLRTTSETAKWVWSFSSCACLVIYLEPKFDIRTLQHLRFFLQQINERMLVIEYLLNKNVKPLHSIGLTLSSEDTFVKYCDSRASIFTWGLTPLAFQSYLSCLASLVCEWQFEMSL